RADHDRVVHGRGAEADVLHPLSASRTLLPRIPWRLTDVDAATVIEASDAPVLSEVVLVVAAPPRLRELEVVLVPAPRGEVEELFDHAGVVAELQWPVARLAPKPGDRTCAFAA